MSNHELSLLVGKVRAYNAWYHGEGVEHNPARQGQALLPPDRRQEVRDFLATLPLALERKPARGARPLAYIPCDAAPRSDRPGVDLREVGGSDQRGAQPRRAARRHRAQSGPTEPLPGADDHLGHRRACRKTSSKPGVARGTKPARRGGWTTTRRPPACSGTTAAPVSTEPKRRRSAAIHAQSYGPTWTHDVHRPGGGGTQRRAARYDTGWPDLRRRVPLARTYGRHELLGVGDGSNAAFIVSGS